MTTFSETEHGTIQRAAAGDRFVYLLECPGCGELGTLDDHQLHGRVSVNHAADGCPGGYHETHDFAAAAEKAGWQCR